MDSIFFRYNALLSIVSENSSYLFRRYFAIRSIFVIFASPFVYAVSVIFKFCSEFKVARIYARRVVACVHDYFSFRNFANKILVRIAMRSNKNFARHEKNTVSILMFCAKPNPARIGFLYSVFKNIVRGKKWEFFKSPFFSFGVIAFFAQFSPNYLFRTTDKAVDFSFDLIGHGAS